MPDHDHGDAPGEAMPVEVLGLQVEPSTGLSIVLLGRLAASDRVLPIFIGPTEAQAIGFALADVELPRPTTHDLFVAAMDAAGAEVSDLAIVAMAERTFIAELGLHTEHGDRRIDARPSDGLALALRVDAPVTVRREVFDAASVAIVQDPSQPFTDDEIDRITQEFRSFIDSADPDDFADGPDERGDGDV